MTVGGKILLTSKCPALKSPLRKPIRGCYCNEPKTIQPRSARTIHKQPSTLCNHCQSNYELFREKPETENILLSPSLSCETLRRVQRINYTPRSEFLRRVQQKVSENYNHCHDEETVDDFPARKDDYESRQIGGASTNRYLSLKNSQDAGKKSRQSGNLRRVIDDDNGASSSDVDAVEEIVVPVDVHRPDESPSEDEITRIHVNLEKTMKTTQKIPSKTSGSTSRQSLGKNKNSQSEIVQVIRDSSPEIETIFPPRENHQRKPKKTISSKSLINKNSKNLEEKKINEKPVRVLSQKSCCYEPCTLNEKNKIKSLKKKKKCCCNCREKCLLNCFQAEKPDHNALELRKFRDKNFFDTHGSKASLLSSESSGSLEHFELNDRLFPESIGKIHRDDLVVSMPFCTTKQLKRIHYFPRHIVQQEKNDKLLSGTNNSCLKKRKHQNCPLTGHAIDLGVLKPQRPKNSLALKFQKASRFKVCARNSANLSECFNEAAAIAITELARGYKELNIPALDPLMVDKFSVGSTKYLKQQYENVNVHGLTKGLKITEYDLDFDNLIFTSTAFNPQVDFVGDYVLDGRILILPIRGHGQCNITMKNLITKSTYYGEKFSKDGEEYMRIKKYVLTFTPKKVLMDFTNLFDGNLLLAGPANYFIKENSDLLFQELQEPFEKAFAKIFMKIANAAFTKIPFNVIFPETLS